MQTLPRTTLTALVALAVAGVGAGSLEAQEPVEADQVCAARVLTSRVDTPDAAARVTITLPQSIGDEIVFEPRAGSGLTLAKAEDLRRVPMANEGEPVKAIEMANEGTSITLFLNTTSAEPGVHEFALVGPEGTCTGTLNVLPGS